jgi:lysophospholipase L1-like esterase
MSSAPSVQARSEERPRPGALAVLARSAAALVAVTLVAELAARALIAEPNVYVKDPARGRVPRPGSSHFQAMEGRARAHYNNLSLRGTEDVGPRAPGEARVLLLGDSLTEAVEVADDETWAAQLERALAAARPGPTRVVNGGRMAYLAGEMLYAADALQPSVDAQAAVVAVRAASFGLDADARVALPGYWRARWLWDGPGARVELLEGYEGPKRLEPLRALKSKSALLDLSFGLALKRLSGGEGDAAPKPDLPLLRRRMSFFLAELHRRFPAGVVVLFLTRQSPLDTAPDTLEQSVATALADACRAQSVPLVDTRPLFAGLFAREHRLAAGFPNTAPPGVGHLNRDGHRAVAEALAPVVRPLLP